MLKTRRKVHEKTGEPERTARSGRDRDQWRQPGAAAREVTREDERARDSDSVGQTGTDTETVGQKRGGGGGGGEAT